MREMEEPDVDREELIRAVVQLLDLLHLTMTAAEELLDDQTTCRQRRPHQNEAMRQGLANIRAEERRAQAALAQLSSVSPDGERGELVLALIQMTDMLHRTLTGAEGQLEWLESGERRDRFYLDLQREGLLDIRVGRDRISELIARVLRDRPLRTGSRDVDS